MSLLHPENTELISQHERWRSANLRLWRGTTPPPPSKREPRVPYGAPFNFLLRPSSRAIVKLVALKHDVPLAEIYGRSKCGPTMAARHEAVYLIHKHCDISLLELGRIFGRDHTTALNSIRAYSRILHRKRRAELQ